MIHHITEKHPDYLKEKDLTRMFPPRRVYENHRKIANMEEVVHDKETGKYVCIVCGQNFTAPRHIVRHVESVHRQMKDAQCEICGKQLTDKKRLKDHMLIHTGEKPFTCEYCGKQFRRKDKMQEHKRGMHKELYAEEKKIIAAEKEQKKIEAKRRVEEQKAEFDRRKAADRKSVV